MSLVIDEYETSMLELQAFIDGRESGRHEAMMKSRVVSKGGAGREQEIALIQHGLNEIGKAHINGQISDQAYTHLRQMALARLEQLGGSDHDAETMAKSVISGMRFGTVAPLAGVQSLIVAGNLAGKVSADYMHDWAMLGR